MGKLEVTPSELVAASQHASRIANDLESQLRALEHEVNDLLTEWTGLSATDFDESWLEWRDGARSVHEALRHSAELLATSARRYADQDATAAQSLPNSFSKEG